LVTPAFATRIWGQIVGLGSVGSSSSIESVRIYTDRNEVFYGYVRVLQGPGLIWEAYVPSRQGWNWFNRNYRVEVRVTGTASEKVRWNPEYSFGYWMGWMVSNKCNDVRFYLW
jgi:hypothetical protein